MGVTIELHNLVDAQLCRDIAAHIQHALADRRGDWRVSIAASRATENWEMGVEDRTALSELIPWRALPVNMNRRQSAD